MGKFVQWFDLIRWLKKNYVYSLQNVSANDTITFCGNCHMAVIADYFNELTEYRYNINVIISWIFQKFEINVNKIIEEKILSAVCESDLFIYQHHFSDLKISATTLPTKCNDHCKAIAIPNIMFTYNENIKDVNESVNKTLSSILNSEYPNFKFIVENIHRIRFTDFYPHPTNYILYLLALQIFLNVEKSKHKITIEDYYKCKDDSVYKSFIPINLPGTGEDVEQINEKLNYYTCREHYH